MSVVKIKDKTFKTFIPEQEILTRVKAVADKINTDMAGKKPLLLAVLNGSFMFAADLMRYITIPCEISFVKLASYEGTTSTGKVKEVIGLNEDICGREVIIVEDIVDTAKTLSALKKLFGERNPKSLKVASLLDKPSRRVVEGFKADYTGFEIEDYFVVGYGLDFSQQYRNLPYIGVYKSE